MLEIIHASNYGKIEWKLFAKYLVCIQQEFTTELLLKFIVHISTKITRR